MCRSLLLGVALLATPAMSNPIAEVICAPADQMRDRITQQFGETLTGRGLRDPDSVVEIWSSDRGTWTLVISYTDGRRCIVAMGEAWDQPKTGLSDTPPA